MEHSEWELEEVYLEHHGIKGQKHGVRRGPPYPLNSAQKSGRSSGSKEEKRKRREERAAKKVSRVGERAKQRELKAKEQTKKNVERKKQREELAKAKAEKKRRDILNDPSKLYKHRREYSQEEIQNALKQFEWEQRLSNYSKERLKNGSDFINTTFNYVNNAVNLYNRAASIVNSLDKDTNLPTIRPASDFYRKLDDKDNKNKK